MRWRSTAHPLRSYGVAWLLQAASRTKSPCALCHSGVSGHVRYVELAQTLEAIEHKQARLGKEQLMAKLLERAWRQAPYDVTMCVALTSLQLSPATRPNKLGIGDALILSALSEASGTPMAELKAELAQVGDLGKVSIANLDAPPEGAEPLTLSEVRRRTPTPWPPRSSPGSPPHPPRTLGGAGARRAARAGRPVGRRREHAQGGDARRDAGARHAARGQVHRAYPASSSTFLTASTRTTATTTTGDAHPATTAGALDSGQAALWAGRPQLAVSALYLA